MDYNAQAQAISNEAQQARVAQSAVKTALQVMSEAGSTAGHAERAAFSVQVLSNPAYWGIQMLRAVVTVPGAGSNDVGDPLVVDDTLDSALASFWSAYAGYSPAA
jgi:hypothetical protein